MKRIYSFLIPSATYLSYPEPFCLMMRVSRYAEQARNGDKMPIIYGFWGRFDEMIRIFHEMISE